MDNIIEAHKAIFQEMEVKTENGLDQLSEFVLLLQDKMDGELVNAKSQKRLSTYQFQRLNQTRYGKIFDEMLNVAESKSVQSLDLIKNIKNDIYEPLGNMSRRQSQALEMISIDGRRAMETTLELEDELWHSK